MKFFQSCVWKSGEPCSTFAWEDWAFPGCPFHTQTWYYNQFFFFLAFYNTPSLWLLLSKTWYWIKNMHHEQILREIIKRYVVKTCKISLYCFQLGKCQNKWQICIFWLRYVLHASQKIVHALGVLSIKNYLVLSTEYLNKLNNICTCLFIGFFSMMRNFTFWILEMRWTNLL